MEMAQKHENLFEKTYFGVFDLCAKSLILECVTLRLNPDVAN